MVWREESFFTVFGYFHFTENGSHFDFLYWRHKTLVTRGNRLESSNGISRKIVRLERLRISK